MIGYHIFSLSVIDDIHDNYIGQDKLINQQYLTMSALFFRRRESLPKKMTEK